MSRLINYQIVVCFVFILIIVFCDLPLNSLPLYTARSGRICDNCHISPFKNEKQDEWNNPSISQRKCNLACQTCHINPGGGGLRTVVGRYYGKNTLPMFGANRRPWHDQKRDFYYWFSETKSDNDDKPKKKPINILKNKPVKRHVEKQHKPHFFYSSDIFAFGYPFNANTLNSQSEYAFARERYGYLNADPLLTLGADIRPTILYRDSETYFFPMQFDVGASIHPVEHLTLSATGTIGALQNGFVMVHELPLMAYLQAGFFLPSYGIRHDDHTAPGRQHLEMDYSKEYDKVLGAEIGIAPNYPYLTFSIFMNRVKYQPFKFDGWGATLTAGWRDLAWGAGISLMLKKNREIQNRGEVKAAGINAYFNIGRLNLDIPLVFQAEFNLGEHSKTIYQTSTFITTLFQIDYLLVNGLNLRFSHHYYKDEPASGFSRLIVGSIDVGVDRANELHRFIAGIDYTILYGLKANLEVRYNKPLDIENPSTDLLFFLHLYI